MTDNLSRADRAKCMSRIRSRDTKPELIVRSMLHSEGFRYRLHRRGMPGCPDIILARYRVAVFIHGCFWHWHPDPNCPIASLPKSNVDYWLPKLTRTRNRDLENISQLEKEGWRVSVIWECQLADREKVLRDFRKLLEQ